MCSDDDDDDNDNDDNNNNDCHYAVVTFAAVTDTLLTISTNLLQRGPSAYISALRKT